jgi:hypothetical protein
MFRRVSLYFVVFSCKTNKINKYAKEGKNNLCFRSYPVSPTRKKKKKKKKKLKIKSENGYEKKTVIK